MTFTFDPKLFAQNSKPDSCIYNGDFYRREVSVLRTLHPEIAAWDDNAIGRAWAAYSAHVFKFRWVTTDWLRESDTGILAYIYLISKTPQFDFSTIAEPDAFVWSVGEIRPWLRNITLSSWKQPALAA